MWPPTPTCERLYRDDPYEPPVFPYNSKEWRTLSSPERERFSNIYRERLDDYNAEYATATGKFPPPEFVGSVDLDILALSIGVSVW